MEDRRVKKIRCVMTGQSRVLARFNTQSSRTERRKRKLVNNNNHDDDHDEWVIKRRRKGNCEFGKNYDDDNI
jgi:hypothetical protein